MRVPRAALSGLGACSQSDPNPGTFSSINCPGSCWWLGNALDTAILGQECWPCGNVCPPGTCWDTTALACSATPTTTNSVVPVTQNDAAPPAPVDCSTTWNQLTNSQCTISTGVYVMGGVAALAAMLLLVMAIGGKR